MNWKIGPKDVLSAAVLAAVEDVCKGGALATEAKIPASATVSRRAPRNRLDTATTVVTVPEHGKIEMEYSSKSIPTKVGVSWWVKLEGCKVIAHPSVEGYGSHHPITECFGLHPREIGTLREEVIPFLPQDGLGVVRIEGDDPYAHQAVSNFGFRSEVMEFRRALAAELLKED